MSGQPETERSPRPVRVEVIAAPGVETAAAAVAVRRVAEAGGIAIELSEVAADAVAEAGRPPVFTTPPVRINGRYAPAAAIRFACGTYG
jgi:hypothetical protein